MEYVERIFGEIGLTVTQWLMIIEYILYALQNELSQWHVQLNQISDDCYYHCRVFVHSSKLQRGRRLHAISLNATNVIH